MRIKKYLRVISLANQEGMQYRLNYTISFLVVAFPLLISILLWKTVYIDMEVLENYTRSMMITYYILAAFIGDFVAVVVWWEITSDIRNGTLSNFLLRPIDYRSYYFSVIKIGANLGYSLVVAIIIGIFVGVFFKSIYIPDLLHFLLFIISFVLSIILSFNITYSLSLTAFWTKENRGLMCVVNFAIPLFMGSLLPLDLFPDFFFNLMKFLPFQYLLYFPINIFLERIDINGVIFGFIIQVIWIAIMYFVGEFVWSRGIKKYEAVGG